MFCYFSNQNSRQSTKKSRHQKGQRVQKMTNIPGIYIYFFGTLNYKLYDNQIANYHLCFRDEKGQKMSEWDNEGQEWTRWFRWRHFILIKLSCLIQECIYVLAGAPRRACDRKNQVFLSHPNSQLVF